MENFKTSEKPVVSLVPEFMNARLSGDRINLNTNNSLNNEGGASFSTLLKERIGNEEPSRKAEEGLSSGNIKQDQNERITSENSMKDPVIHQRNSKPDENPRTAVKQADSGKNNITSGKAEKNRDDEKKTDDKIASLAMLIETLKKILSSAEGNTNKENFKLNPNGKSISFDALIKELSYGKNTKKITELDAGELKKLSEFAAKFKNIKITAGEKSELKKLIQNLEKHKSELTLKTTSPVHARKLSAYGEIHGAKNSMSAKHEALNEQSRQNLNSLENLSKINIDGKSFNSGNENADSFESSDKEFSLFRSMLNPSRTANHSSKPEGSLLFRQQLNELLEKSKIVVKDSRNSSIVMKLFPEKLGNLNVSMGLENGVLTGKFLVESDEAKQLLMNDLASLKTTLEEAGISVGGFEVNVRSGKQQNWNMDENITIKDNYVTDFIEEATENYRFSESDYRSHHLNMVI